MSEDLRRAVLVAARALRAAAQEFDEIANGEPPEPDPTDEVVQMAREHAAMMRVLAELKPVARAEAVKRYRVAMELDEVHQAKTPRMPAFVVPVLDEVKQEVETAVEELRRLEILSPEVRAALAEMEAT